MNTEQIQAIKAAALAANKEWPSNAEESAFQMLAYPSAVLELIELAERATAAPAESVDSPELWSLIAALGHTERRGRDDSTARADIIAHIDAWAAQRYEAGHQAGYADHKELMRECLQATGKELPAAGEMETLRARAERAEAALENTADENNRLRDALKDAQERGMKANATIAKYTQQIIALEAALASRPAVDLSATDVRMLNVVGRYLTMKDESPKCSADLMNLAGRIQALLSGKVEAPNSATTQKAATLANENNGLGDNSASQVATSPTTTTASPAAADAVAVPADDPMRKHFTCQRTVADYGAEYFHTKMGAHGTYSLYRNEATALRDNLTAALGTPATPSAGDTQTTASAYGLPPPADGHFTYDPEEVKALVRQARADALEDTITLIRNNYQDHNIASLCDAIRALNKKG